jgi:succinyldiaminopimelate transaminase
MDALAQATDAHDYPLTAGSEPLRAAIASWYQRRRGVTVAPEAVLPTVGSKELVALLPFLLGLGEGDVIVHPQVAYPTYAMSAALVGATAVAEDDPANWPDNAKLVWLNSPANPTGQVRDVNYLRSAVARAREIGALIANDECYAELGWAGNWANEPTPSILHPTVVGDDHTGVLSVYSLSKQSKLAGYRAAFLAGDQTRVSELLNVRKHAGLMLPAPVQSAMTVALADDAHVAEQKARYAARRAVLIPALQQAGYSIKHSEAGLYLWATRNEDCWNSVAEFAELGILVGPGSFYGDEGDKFIRLSLTASDERIASAASRLTALQ